MDINKADESLKAAGHCFHEGLYNSSVSRAYYSMYQAAQTALEGAGLLRTEWTHAGLQATSPTNSPGDGNFILPF